jgi:hydrogenase maturation factor
MLGVWNLGFKNMCLSLPYKVLKIEGKILNCFGFNKKKIKAVNLIGKIKIGDFVLIQNNTAVRKLSKADFDKIIKFFDK